MTGRHGRRRAEGPPRRRLRARRHARGGDLRRRAARARDELRRPGDRRDEAAAPIVVHPGNEVEVDDYGNLHHRARRRERDGDARPKVDDPITLEIIQNSLQAISDEMFAAFRKTAMSAIIYEVLDMGTGITDGARRPRVVRRRHPGLRRRARQGREARSSSSNSAGRDSARATSSPPTIPSTAASRISTTSSLAMPVFAGGELVAWTANIAHWNDVGGMVPGSISSEATRDLPGGAAAAGGEADLRRASRSAR